jgi:chromosome segregation ATPase
MVAYVSYQLSGAQERRRNNEAKANEFYERVRKQEQELRDLQAKLGNTEKQYADLQVQKSEIDDRLRQLASSMDSTNRALADLRTQIASKKTGHRTRPSRDGEVPGRGRQARPRDWRADETQSLVSNPACQSGLFTSTPPCGATI